MKKASEIKSDLSKAAEILAACNEKAIVLKVCNDFVAQEDCFPEIEKEDLALVYGGISRILYEIIQQVSEAISLIGDVEHNIDGLGKPVKEARA